MVAHWSQSTKLILRRARLVLGWVTVSWFNSWCGTFISECNQLPRSTQPGHPFVGRRNEYQPKGVELTPYGWRVKAGTWFMCEWQVKLCDPLVTHGPYLSPLEIEDYKALYKFTFFTLLFVNSWQYTGIVCRPKSLISYFLLYFRTTKSRMLANTNISGFYSLIFIAHFSLAKECIKQLLLTS